MATRVKGGALLPVIVVVAAVAVFGGNKVLDTVTGLFGGGGTAVIGEGDLRVMVASGAEPEAEKCGAKQMLTDKRCGDFSVVVFNAKDMPFITRNISEAWGSGRPGVLTMNRPKQAANRAKACGRFKKQHRSGSCDEYPMAATDEGGAGARTEEVPLRENLCHL